MSCCVGLSHGLHNRISIKFGDLVNDSDVKKQTCRKISIFSKIPVEIQHIVAYVEASVRMIFIHVIGVVYKITKFYADSVV